MSWFRGKKPAATNRSIAPAAWPAFEPADLRTDRTDLHFCCICGTQIFGLDLEDELDGEGPGNDICGDCNRTKNFETMMGNE